MVRKFSFFSSRFLAWASKCRSPITVAVYKHYFEKFLREVGDKRVDKINTALLAEWARTWHASQAIVRLFRWAVDDARLLKVSPIGKAIHPPKGQRRRCLTEEQGAQILRASPSDLRNLLFAYRETMARPGELRAATWDDVHPHTTRAKLRKALRAGEGMIVLHDYKCRKARRLPNVPRVILLSPRVGRLLCRLMEKFTDGAEKIFRTERGKAWTANALRCRMRRLRSRLKLKRDARGENIVPYTWRHTGATNASAAGIRDRMLADVLGHTETVTTARYQHLQAEQLREAMLRFWQTPPRVVKISKRKSA